MEATSTDFIKIYLNNFSTVSMIHNVAEIRLLYGFQVKNVAKCNGSYGIRVEYLEPLEAYISEIRLFFAYFFTINIFKISSLI